MKNLLILLVLSLLIPVAYAFHPCESEDSTFCYWDGGSNGQGTRFIALTEELVIKL